VQNLRIFRDDKGSPFFIGDAVFVEGARPDVEAAYPDYPLNYKAGWGYMMLTNSLPNGGNGVFKIYAVATDLEGKNVTLGVKTITIDNAHAVKPFGYIDTPAQGGLASGSDFINWGWALTPQPNIIPTDGSTISVWVDGVSIGRPVYNKYRADIASIFPGYANTNGAVGYFHLDTTAYQNGVHTLYWNVIDNAGNSEGIGSRYFSVRNAAHDSAQGAAVLSEDSTDLFPGFGPAFVKKGYDDNIKPEEVYPDDNGVIHIEIKELERIEIHFFEDSALHIEHRTLRLSPLPIGSTFDKERGVFYWHPGAGFLGTYHFVLIEKDETGLMDRKDIVVNIAPL
jgi:hypothetical protein